MPANHYLRTVKPLLIILFVLSGFCSAYSQSDLLVLKQRNQTIQTWIPGSMISFQFSSKQWLDGIIKAVRNDSILMEQIILRQVPDRFGFPTTDTAKMGLLKLHINEIYGMPKRNFGAGVFTNGLLFKMGSAAYIFLNVFNSLIHNEQVFSSVNLSRIGIAGGVYLLGSLLAANHSNYVIMGKKYRLQTIHM